MSLIENLLLNVNDTGDVKSPKTSKGNFLIDLLNSYKDDNEKLTDLLKSLNINEKDLEKFFNSDKNELSSDLKALIDKIKNSLKTKTKEPEIKTDIQNNKTNPIKNNDEISTFLKDLINKTPISNEKFEKKIIEKIKKQDSNTDTNIVQNIQTDIRFSKTDKKIEEKIVKVTKEIIISQKTLEKLKLNDKEINEFKQITSFKKLIDFANKKNMNISKIIISYEKQTDAAQLQKSKLPKNKIEIKNVKNFSKLSFSQPQKTDSNTSKELLSTLLQKNDKTNENLKYINSLKNSKLTTSNTAKETQKDLLSTLLQKNEKKENLENISSFNLKHQNDKHKTDNSNQRQNETHTQTSAQTNVIQNLKQNIHKAKESIKHFATNLKDAIDNYKPPISKLSMELHPKELGKVEVTIVHRGDNLQIQINSNNTAVNFLHSAQQELKQNLINMGFTDVNMSFNQQQQQQQQANKQYKQNQKFTNNEENDELIIEIPYQYA